MQISHIKICRSERTSTNETLYFHSKCIHLFIETVGMDEETVVNAVETQIKKPSPFVFLKPNIN